MTVAELDQRMSAAEFVEWIAHDSLVAAEVEHARLEREAGII